MPELIHTSRRIFLDTENASITLSDGESTFRFGGNGFTADLESADADQIHFTLRSPLHPQPVTKGAAAALFGLILQPLHRLVKLGRVVGVLH